jgi:hypothetical protein
MIQVFCDSCNKEVRQPSRGVNYISVLGYDLCLPCRDDLVRQTGKEVLKKGAYHLKAYHAAYEQTLRRMCK